MPGYGNTISHTFNAPGSGGIFCLPDACKNGTKKHANTMEFGEYLPLQEPDRAGRIDAWQAAIGLQAVDGLQTSEYLLQTAKRNIDGEISIDEAQKIIHAYYDNRSTHAAEGEEEADKVATNIARLLGENAFRLIPATLPELHRRIFTGVYKFAGNIRDVNISKKEWVLRGDSVLYTPAPLIRETLEWDIRQELNFNYDGISMEEAIEHIGLFISGVWQIHPFAEGNTRTTAVLLIKYLRFMGFEVDNSPFARYSWYFRNALVRASYRNSHKRINKDTTFLRRFLSNLLIGTHYELKNRFMLIPEAPTEQVTEQVPSSEVSDLLSQYSEQLKTLIKVMKNDAYSMKKLMDLCGIKHRPSFTENYIKPAIANGIIKPTHEENPNHPRQKYHLTIKGLLLHNNTIT